jgi:integrase
MDDDRIFPLTANGFKLAWKRALHRAKIEDLRFHDLRHEAISRFFEFGLTAPEVASISGHRDMRMLFRYSHSDRQRLFRQLDALPQSELYHGGMR